MWGLIAFGLMVLVLAYQVVACVGVWRSAGTYSGRLIYSMLARAVLVVYLALLATDVATVAITR